MFAVISLGLLIAPVLAALTFIAFPKDLSRASFKAAFGGSVLVLLLLWGIGLAGISFTEPVFNGASLVAGYFAYCFLASVCWLIPNIVVRIIALVIAAIPVVFGYLLSTIGILALMFVVGDYTRPPDRVEQMAPGLTCRVTGWGAVGASSGYAVNLFQTFSAIPFLERRVHGHSVIQVGHLGPRPADVSCSSIWAEYSK
jgi:hypothetical protein